MAESHPNAKQMFRCRLDSAWSFPARVTLVTAMAVNLLAIGLFRNAFPWIWFVLLSLPAMAWYFSQEQRNLQAMLMAFLDETARARGMIKLNQTDTGPDQVLPGNTSRPSS